MTTSYLLTDAMLDQLEIQPGSRCVDLGCGAIGILQNLSRRVGNAGAVIGIDVDDKQLAFAREHTLPACEGNVKQSLTHRQRQALLTQKLIVDAAPHRHD